MSAAGLLLMRLVVGLTLVAHEWRNRQDPGHARSQVDRLGLRPRVLWVLPARFMKPLGGALMALGLATPVGGALIFSSMLMAALSKRSKGFWNFNGGCEYPLILALTAAGLAVAGPGKYSVDAAWGLRHLFEQPGIVQTLLAVALAVTIAGWATRRVDAPMASAHGRGPTHASTDG